MSVDARSALRQELKFLWATLEENDSAGRGRHSSWNDRLSDKALVIALRHLAEIPEKGLLSVLGFLGAKTSAQAREINDRFDTYLSEMVVAFKKEDWDKAVELHKKLTGEGGMFLLIRSPKLREVFNCFMTNRGKYVPYTRFIKIFEDIYWGEERSRYCAALGEIESTTDPEWVEWDLKALSTIMNIRELLNNVPDDGKIFIEKGTTLYPIPDSLRKSQAFARFEKQFKRIAEMMSSTVSCEFPLRNLLGDREAECLIPWLAQVQERIAESHRVAIRELERCSPEVRELAALGFPNVRTLGELDGAIVRERESDPALVSQFARTFHKQQRAEAHKRARMLIQQGSSQDAWRAEREVSGCSAWVSAALARLRIADALPFPDASREFLRTVNAKHLRPPAGMAAWFSSNDDREKFHRVVQWTNMNLNDAEPSYSRIPSDAGSWNLVQSVGYIKDALARVDVRLPRKEPDPIDLPTFSEFMQGGEDSRSRARAYVDRIKEYVSSQRNHWYYSYAVKSAERTKASLEHFRNDLSELHALLERQGMTLDLSKIGIERYSPENLAESILPAIDKQVREGAVHLALVPSRDLAQASPLAVTPDRASKPDGVGHRRKR
jgi:hypothetical protein